MNIQSERIFYHVPVKGLLDDLDYYLGLGVNYEIYINSDFIDEFSLEDIDLINKGFAGKKISKRIHGPFMDLSPASFDSKVRDLSTQRILSGLDICARLRCDNIVFHSHYDPVYHKRHFSEWSENSEKTWSQAQEYAIKNNITINIENSEDDIPDPVLYLLGKFKSFRACFDLAHYTIFGKAGWRQILASYPEGSINEIHLSDNDRKEDLHLILGRGSVEIMPLLDELISPNSRIAITVEPHSAKDMLEDIEYMKNLNSNP
jgi:sugar phosphate isomerase/epimerase